MTHNLTKERVKYTLADETALLKFLNSRKACASNGSGIISTNFTGKQADWKAAATMLSGVKTDGGITGQRTSESCRAKYRQVKF